MKNLLYALVLLFGLISSAQNEILMEHIWELEYIELDGETLYQPENEESNTTINLEIGQSFYNPGTFFKEHNLICDEFICGPIEFTSATTFNFLFCELSLEGCNIEGNILFQSNYMMVFQDLMGGGSALNPFTYSFVTEEDIIYLTITNSDGNSATYSATTLSDTEFKEPKFSIYPNPVTNTLYIESNNAQIQKIEIFSLNGKRVLALNYQKNQNIEVSKLENGIYFLKIHTENRSFTKSLLKN